MSCRKCIVCAYQSSKIEPYQYCMRCRTTRAFEWITKAEKMAKTFVAMIIVFIAFFVVFGLIGLFRCLTWAGKYIVLGAMCYSLSADQDADVVYPMTFVTADGFLEVKATNGVTVNLRAFNKIDVISLDKVIAIQNDGIRTELSTNWVTTSREIPIREPMPLSYTVLAVHIDEPPTLLHQKGFISTNTVIEFVYKGKPFSLVVESERAKDEPLTRVIAEEPKWLNQ
jgi:hypothetical protein